MEVIKFNRFMDGSYKVPGISEKEEYYYQQAKDLAMALAIMAWMIFILPAVPLFGPIGGMPVVDAFLQF
jgi:hypothetical protein